ncbi:hypothetical protein GCM10009744_32860 [Kribbella alba]|uniref:Uncharacterized protein n=1 Tax=Kribbella alba TaxID=190197 RepID=A0ABP4R8C3_9ACTN
MITIEIDFSRAKPVGDRHHRRNTDFRWTGAAEPYGEIELWAGNVPRVATVTATGLPAVEVRYPDSARNGPLPLDERTTMTIDGVVVRITSGRGLAKKDRALRIEVGERSYTYLVTGTNVEELRDGDGNPLVEVKRLRGPKPIKLIIAPTARPEALALALALLMVDSKLTVTRAALSGALKIFDSGQGEPG